MVTVIAACEVGFWVLLVLGLAVRYLLRWRRTSTVLLVSVPLVDLVLLGFTVIDLSDGGKATIPHGLAAIFLGCSVAFGHSMMRWADQRFSHRFAGGPPPWKPPKDGRERIVYEWREWGKFMLAFGIAGGVIALLTFVVSTPENTTVLWQWTLPKMGVVAVIWLFWPLSKTFSTPAVKT